LISSNLGPASTEGLSYETWRSPSRERRALSFKRLGLAAPFGSGRGSVAHIAAGKGRRLAVWRGSRSLKGPARRLCFVLLQPEARLGACRVVLGALWTFVHRLSYA